MDYGTAKERAIQLINEYSNNGNLIAPSTNADYTLRFPMLADDCQNEISDKVGIEASVTLETPSSAGNGYNKYTIPASFKENRFVRMDDKDFYDYRIENGNFMVSTRFTGTIEWFYYRYPTEITSSTDDNFEFEVDPYTHRLIPYYMSGMVVADEKEGVSNKLLNIYYELLKNTFKRNTTYPRSHAIAKRW